MDDLHPQSSALATVLHPLSSNPAFLVLFLEQPTHLKRRLPLILLPFSRCTYAILGRQSPFIVSTCLAHFAQLFTNHPIRHFCMLNSSLRSPIFIRSTLFTPCNSIHPPAVYDVFFRYSYCFESLQELYLFRPIYLVSIYDSLNSSYTNVSCFSNTTLRWSMSMSKNARVTRAPRISTITFLECKQNCHTRML